MKLAWIALCIPALTLTAAYRSAPKLSVISKYSTSLSGRTPNQRHNALLALDDIDNVTIGPGETLSFNHLVKGWSVSDGFRKAPVSYDGRLVDDWGGGVCQTSSTLYNTALLCGFEIVERHRHHFSPSYIAPGRDAAVAQEVIDLRIRNPFPEPVRIHTYVIQSEMYVEFLSTYRPSERPAVRLQIQNRSLPKTLTIGQDGRRAVRNSGKSGYEVLVWRDWKGRSELLSHDTYPVMDRVIEYHR